MNWACWFWPILLLTCGCSKRRFHGAEPRLFWFVAILFVTVILIGFSTFLLQWFWLAPSSSSSSCWAVAAWISPAAHPQHQLLCFRPFNRIYLGIAVWTGICHVVPRVRHCIGASVLTCYVVSVVRRIIVSNVWNCYVYVMLIWNKISKGILQFFSIFKQLPNNLKKASATLQWTLQENIEYFWSDWKTLRVQENILETSTASFPHNGLNTFIFRVMKIWYCLVKDKIWPLSLFTLSLLKKWIVVFHWVKIYFHYKVKKWFSYSLDWNCGQSRSEIKLHVLCSLILI